MMIRAFLLGTACFMLASSTAIAQKAEFGTAAEAKSMLEKAVAALKADKAKALADFNKGAAGFSDRDLYPFCANASDGIFTAHPKLAGKSFKELKDKEGKAIGETMLSQAKDGAISEVEYKWPRPGSDAPVQKVTYFTKTGDQVCGVGYYK